MAVSPNHVNFAAIMQAIENRLVADGVVESAAQIAWGTPDSVPQFSGPLDILLIIRNGQHTPYDGGAQDFRVLRYLDVWQRSEAIAEPGGGFKAWIIAVIATADKTLNSVGNDNFWPEDVAGNLLTIESIKLLGDVAPARPSNDMAFGDYVCTLAIRYFPGIDPARGP